MIESIRVAKVIEAVELVIQRCEIETGHRPLRVCVGVQVWFRMGDEILTFHIYTTGAYLVRGVSVQLDPTRGSDVYAVPELTYALTRGVPPGAHVLVE